MYKNGTFDIVAFGNDKLYCPVVNGEPYVIINPVIDKIGLNYRRAIDTIKNGRLGKFIGSIQIKNGQNQSTERWISFEKNGEIYEFPIQNYAQWVHILKSMKGYKYVAIPVRKIAAWLYSIDNSKVKESVRTILEKYQDECDDVLFDHFFGNIARRKVALEKKAEIKILKEEKMKELENNEAFKQYQDLCAEEMRIGKELIECDKQYMAIQLKLF